MNKSFEMGVFLFVKQFAAFWSSYFETKFGISTITFIRWISNQRYHDLGKKENLRKKKSDSRQKPRALSPESTVIQGKPHL